MQYWDVMATHDGPRFNESDRCKDRSGLADKFARKPTDSSTVKVKHGSDSQMGSGSVANHHGPTPTPPKKWMGIDPYTNELASKKKPNKVAQFEDTGEPAIQVAVCEPDVCSCPSAAQCLCQTCAFQPQAEFAHALGNFVRHTMSFRGCRRVGGRMHTFETNRDQQRGDCALRFRGCEGRVITAAQLHFACNSLLMARP
jgi:hypothetical protein